MMIVSLLRRFGVPMVLALMGLAIGGVVYRHIYQSGYDAASTVYEARLAHQMAAFAQARTQAAMASNQALSAAVVREQDALAKADRLSDALARQQQQLARAQHLLRGKIHDAVTQDGPGFTGLGPDSVQLYARALGYAGTGSDAVSPAAGGLAHVAPDAGLPPVALLQHASDYGAWCLTLRNRLQLLGHFYQPAAHHE